jgi:hypothetical protein
MRAWNARTSLKALQVEAVSRHEIRLSHVVGHCAISNAGLAINALLHAGRCIAARIWRLVLLDGRHGGQWTELRSRWSDAEGRT